MQALFCESVPYLSECKPCFVSLYRISQCASLVLWVCTVFVSVSEPCFVSLYRISQCASLVLWVCTAFVSVQVLFCQSVPYLSVCKPCFVSLYRICQCVRASRCRGGWGTVEERYSPSLLCAPSDTATYILSCDHLQYQYVMLIRGVFGKFKDFCYNLNSNRNWQTRKTPLKCLILSQPAVKIAMWYTHKWEN